MKPTKSIHDTSLITKAAIENWNMKLNFFFLLMDLAILAAYPFVFLAGRLRQFSKFMERKTLANSRGITPKLLDG